VLTERTRMILLGASATVGAFLLFGGGALRGKEARPIDAIPRDAFLVASVDAAELRRSPLYHVAFGKDSPTGLPRADPLSPQALGITKLEEACGFDPLARVESFALGVPEEGDRGEIGVAARVQVTEDELGRCATAMRRGPTETKHMSGFAVVEASGEEGVRPRLGFGHGLLVVGRGAWFDAMLAAADQKAPNVSASAAHAALRAALTSREGWHVPTVLVTVLLPRTLRERLKNEMGAEIGSKDASQAIMAGVLGVSSAGFAFRSGSNLDAAAELVCDSDDACAAVEKLILKKRFEASREMMLRMIGLGPLLDSVQVERAGSRVRVTATANAEHLASTLDRVLRYRARDVRPPAPAGTPAKPDETVPAAKPK
jgi:hypothetical protein